MSLYMYVQIGPACTVTDSSSCSPDSITTSAHLGLLAHIIGVSVCVCVCVCVCVRACMHVWLSIVVCVHVCVHTFV